MKLRRLVPVVGCCAILATVIVPVRSVHAGDITYTPQVCSEAGGEWISSVGSVLILQVSGNVLSGTFDKKYPPPYEPGIRKLHGSISSKVFNPPQYTCPLSFSVDWPQQGEFYATVTSYTGRLEPDPRNPTKMRLRTILLAVNPHNPGYSAVSVTTNYFRRPKE